MARLAAWSIAPKKSPGGAAAQPRRPERLRSAPIAMEKELEDWLVEDPLLIGEGLTLVGRQVSMDDGRLDLLALDAQDRWVVIEVKPGILDAGALGQAIYYASSLVRQNAEELYAKLKDGLGQFGNAESLSAKLKQRLADEDRREVALLVIGAGIHPGLERVNEFLSGFGVPITIVSFEVFKLGGGGPQLLVREVVEEPDMPPPPRRRYTVDAIRAQAVEAGVGKEFDRFVNMADNAGLAVQPQKMSVRIAPPANRTRYLMYAGPRASEGGGELGIWAGPKDFAKWFPHIEEFKATRMLGGDGAYLGGEELRKRLDEIEEFLKEHFPAPESGEARSR